MLNILFIFLGIYLFGCVITYVITKKRANWVIHNKTDIDVIDEYSGAFILSSFSFIGLIIFLLIRVVDITTKQLDKLFKL